MKNREIKFRAWDSRLKMYFPTSDAWFQLRGGEIELPKETVLMQFTGFKDKNGKEIYEGDILVYKKTLGTVNYLDQKIGRRITKPKKQPKVELHYWEVFMSPKGQWQVKRNGISQSLHGAIDNHEVAGNIYENSDLIK